jgi:hypothetical protein
MHAMEESATLFGVRFGSLGDDGLSASWTLRT